MKGYHLLIQTIAGILEQGRTRATASVNHILVQTYWQIGKQIVEYEQKGSMRAIYGTRLLIRLSKDLKKTGPGFSRSNLENMRLVYLSHQKSQPVAGKLSWTHYCLIIRIQDPLARNFYLIETEKHGWSKRELLRQIDSMLFERLALSKNKEDVKRLAAKGQVIEKPQDILKEPYVLDFLGLEMMPSYTESELEQKIIDKIEKFLLELGSGFT